jgi:hypothetical protein
VTSVETDIRTHAARCYSHEFAPLLGTPLHRETRLSVSLRSLLGRRQQTSSRPSSALQCLITMARSGASSPCQFSYSLSSTGSSLAPHSIQSGKLKSRLHRWSKAILPLRWRVASGRFLNSPRARMPARQRASSSRSKGIGSPPRSATGKRCTDRRPEYLWSVIDAVAALFRNSSSNLQVTRMGRRRMTRFQAYCVPSACQPGIRTSAVCEFGAGNETRTRDPDLGKVVLYQLSYSRIRKRRARDSMCTPREVKAACPSS